MEYCKITAIVRCERLEKTEQALRGAEIDGISVSQVKGYGEYENFFSRDLMCRHARIEIFTAASRAEEIARTIMQAAHIGEAGDGIVAILPVQQLYRIRTQSEVPAGEMQPRN